MVTSKNGIIHRRCCIFSNILSWFIDNVFLLIMSMFFGKYCIFCILKITIRCCIFSAYHDSAYCSSKDLFAIYMHILHICSTWKTRDGRTCVKNFGVLGVSGLKTNRVRMPVGDCLTVFPTIM